MDTKEMKQHVIDEFSGESAQKLYKEIATTGLWESEESLINKHFTNNNGSLLDIGCGTGRTTIPLVKRGFKVKAIDLTPAMISIAKAISKKLKLKIDYKVGDATKLNFKDKSFDYAIFSNQGYTQIPGSKERQKAVNEVFRVLKKEGIYIFSFHKRRLMSRYFFYLIWMWIRFYIFKHLGFKIMEESFGDRMFTREHRGTRYKKKQYIHIASVKEMKQLVKNAGFEIIYEGTGLNEESRSTPIFFVCKKP